MLQSHPDIEDGMKEIRLGMIEFMLDAGYTETDINLCMGIIRSFLSELDQPLSIPEASELVKNTVGKLNQLNAGGDHELIETDQREEIAELINLAFRLKGYSDGSVDITEEWRTW